MKSVIDVNEWVEASGDLGARTCQSLWMLWEKIIVLLKGRSVDDDDGDVSGSGRVDERDDEWEDEEQDEDACGDALCAKFLGIGRGWIGSEQIQLGQTAC